MFNSIESVLLFLVWPLLIFFSALVFARGLKVRRLIKDAVVGQIVKALIYTTFVDISSLGAICTLYLFNRKDDAEGDYFLFIMLGVWFIVFIWSLKTLARAQKELKKAIE
jgi:hypothetical protein